MKREQTFTRDSVAYGIEPEDLASLTKLQRRKILRLMARIAERSYRRGFQHGTLGGHTIDPTVLRFERSLDNSPYTDGPGGHTSIERLLMECGELQWLGFDGQEVPT